MKKIAISLIILLVCVIIFAFVFPTIRKTTLDGRTSVPEEEVSFVGTFGQLYEGLSAKKQECLRNKLDARVVEDWRTDSDKRMFTKKQVELINSCLVILEQE